MKLSIKERLQLSYQLKILEKLYPEEEGHYSTTRKAIEDGYELHYNWLTQHIFDGLSSEECSFVLDVLDMYTTFYHLFNQLEKPKELVFNSIIFPGFDGNNEIMYMAYTRYFIEDLNRFKYIKETKGGDYNSHMQLIPKYKKMVKRWKELREGIRNEITEDNVIELLKIRGY